MSKRRRRWAEMICMVFEVDPLLIKIFSFITTAQDQVNRRIPDHLVVSTVVPRAS